jgi:hypothetical protein
MVARNPDTERIRFEVVHAPLVSWQSSHPASGTLETIRRFVRRRTTADRRAFVRLDLSQRVAGARHAEPNGLLCASLYGSGPVQIPVSDGP